jgi:hypothetical protein
MKKIRGKVIIQIGGYKRSGKDTISKMIANHYESNGKLVDIFHYADPLKQIAASIFNISLEALDEFKNNKTNLWRFDNYDNAYLITDFREVLMKIGNEAIKPIFGNDVWQRIMFEKIEKSEADIIIIPDFRFKVEHIPNAVTIRINNSDIVNDTDHPSETELLDFDFNMSIDNTSYTQTQEEVSYYCEQMIDNYIKQKHGDTIWKK